MMSSISSTALAILSKLTMGRPLLLGETMATGTMMARNSFSIFPSRSLNKYFANTWI
jgi:hypothetical protein